MYVPAHFALDAPGTAALLASVEAVDLITPSPDGLIATFLPMMYEPADGGPGSLLGHVARNNPHWQAGAEAESLVISHGPDAYVSPRFYPSKAEHGRVVPTWNYVTAHVHGRLVVHDDVDWLRTLVTRLTERHEAAAVEPWRVSDAPAAFTAGQLRAIVGVELVISRVEAKAKLSQNRSVEDRAGVVAGLSGGSPSGQATADAMGLLAP